MAFIVWHITSDDPLGFNGARGVYSTKEACPVEDSDDDLVIEYDFDPSTEDMRSLQLSADKTTISNKYPGKTLAEQRTLIMDAEKAEILNNAKARLKERIGTWTKEILEEWDWKTEKAEEQDFLAGNNVKMTALAAERKAIRDAGNVRQGQVDALTDLASVEVFDYKHTSKESTGLGPNRMDDF